MHTFEIGTKDRNEDFVSLHTMESEVPDVPEDMIQTRDLPFDIPPRPDGEPRKGLSIRWNGQVWFVNFKDD